MLSPPSTRDNVTYVTYNPTKKFITPSGRKVIQAEKRKKEKKMPLIVDT
jgi:hypothetical protein